jgi:hypothetical protein
LSWQDQIRKNDVKIIEPKINQPKEEKVQIFSSPTQDSCEEFHGVDCLHSNLSQGINSKSLG